MLIISKLYFNVMHWAFKRIQKFVAMLLRELPGGLNNGVDMHQYLKIAAWLMFLILAFSSRLKREQRCVE